nr:hypothetical protein [Nesterenkonia sp. GX14115]
MNFKKRPEAEWKNSSSVLITLPFSVGVGKTIADPIHDPSLLLAVNFSQCVTAVPEDQIEVLVEKSVCKLILNTILPSVIGAPAGESHLK